jgi:hypothetical protein
MSSALSIPYRPGSSVASSFLSPSVPRNFVRIRGGGSHSHLRNSPTASSDIWGQASDRRHAYLAIGRSHAPQLTTQSQKGAEANDKNALGRGNG